MEGNPLLWKEIPYYRMTSLTTEHFWSSAARTTRIMASNIGWPAGVFLLWLLIIKLSHVDSATISPARISNNNLISCVPPAKCPPSTPGAPTRSSRAGCRSHYQVVLSARRNLQGWGSGIIAVILFEAFISASVHSFLFISGTFLFISFHFGHILLFAWAVLCARTHPPDAALRSSINNNDHDDNMYYHYYDCYHYHYYHYYSY